MAEIDMNTLFVCPECGGQVEMLGEIEFIAEPQEFEFVCLDCGWEAKRVLTIKAVGDE